MTNPRDERHYAGFFVISLYFSYVAAAERPEDLMEWVSVQAVPPLRVPTCLN